MAEETNILTFILSKIVIVTFLFNTSDLLSSSPSQLSHTSLSVKMGIWGLVSSKAEAVKRNAPDATPVKNACRNSYNLGSAAFAKIDQTVRTIALRRVAQWRPADDIPPKEVETDGGVVDAKSMKNGCTSCCSYGYGFITFSKIGYTVRVKGVYRIVRWMKNDGSKSIPGIIHATNFAPNAELHESKDIVEFIPGQAFAMPMEKQCMNSYTFGSITFVRIGYIVRVNVYRFGQWMADDDTKSRMSLYSTIFAKKACRYALQNCYKLVHGGVGVGVALFVIVSNTLIDIIHECEKVWKEKAGSPQEQLSGEAGFLCAMKECLICMVNEFIGFMMEEPFRSGFLCKGVFTMKCLVLVVREVLVFTMKRYFGTQVSQTYEIVGAILRAVFGSEIVNDFEFHESTTKKGRKPISW